MIFKAPSNPNQPVIHSVKSLKTNKNTGLDDVLAYFNMVWFYDKEISIFSTSKLAIEDSHIPP